MGRSGEALTLPKWYENSHVPLCPKQDEQMIRFNGYYSNVSLGKRKRQEQDEWIH
jgi:hypothetical protein